MRSSITLMVDAPASIVVITYATSAANILAAFADEAQTSSLLIAMTIGTTTPCFLRFRSGHL